MAQEVTYAAAPFIQAGRLIPSPLQFLTTEDDNLRVVSLNAKAGVTIAIQGRRLNPDGKAVPFTYVHTPNTDRTAKTTDFKFGAGAVLNLTVFVSGGAPMLGQTYVLLQLIRGLSGATIVIGTLLGGYVTATQALGFPGSPIQSSIEGGGYARQLTGTTPAAGAEVNETVPTGARWRLNYFQAFLTASAAPATRAPRLSFNTGSPALIHLPTTGTIPAAGSHYFGWAEGSAFDSDHSSNVSSGSLPSAAILVAGQVIATNTEGLQVGDQWSLVTYGVQEFLDF
jgi:hypothetical protein